MQNQSIESEKLIQTLFRSNHQLGVITRFASGITHFSDIDSLMTEIVGTLEELGLHGLIQTKTEEYKFTKNFGGSIDKASLEKLEVLILCEDKICKKQNYLMFSCEFLTLIIDMENLTDIESDDFQDNLAIFCDLVNAWFKNHVDFCTLETSAKLYREDMIQRISELGVNVKEKTSTIYTDLQRISHNLLSMLASRFPTLGLELDQEDEIMNSVESVIENYTKLIESQIKSNNSLYDMLNETTEYLKLG